MNEQPLAPGNPIQGLANLVEKVVFNLRLTWRLFWDRRVRFLPKLIPLGAFVYVISPFDFIPESILGPLGMTDDFAVTYLGITLFWQLCPPEVVAEHKEALAKGR